MSNQFQIFFENVQKKHFFLNPTTSLAFSGSKNETIQNLNFIPNCASYGCAPEAVSKRNVTGSIITNRQEKSF